MSRRRQGVLFSRYSELPSRYTRRFTRTSCHSIPSSSAQSVNVTETSANPTGLRVSALLKITSAISSPRSDLADCSPSAQRTASSTLDFPQPFGPTIAVTPSWKLRRVLSANDLKPSSSSDCKCMVGETSGLSRSIQQAWEGDKRKTHNLEGFRERPTTGYWVEHGIPLILHSEGGAEAWSVFSALPLCRRGEVESEGP